MQIDSGQLSAFNAVLREGSFDAAAKALFVTSSAISQRIKQLEDRLGHVLIQRGQPCLPTVAGQALQRYAHQLALLESEALGALGLDRETQQPLPISLAVNADSLATWFAAPLARAASACNATFDLVVEDQEHTRELLRSGRVMAAITSDPSAVQGCDVSPLGAMRYAAVAHPDFVQRFFSGKDRATAFTAAPRNVFNRKDKLQSEYLKRLGLKNTSSPINYVPSTHGFVEAARAGLGWGMNPLMLIEAALATGDLVELVARTRLDVPLFWQRVRLTSSTLDRLTHEVMVAARSALVRKPQSATALESHR